MAPEVASGVGGAQNPQVTSAGHFHRVRGARPPATAARAPVVRACRFADRVGQCFEVVAAGLRGCGTVGEPHHFPAPWRGKPLTVFGAEVVTVGLGVGGERAEDRSRIGIDVRQCRDGRAAARGARTATYRAHDVGRYRTLERAATTARQVTPPCRPVTCGTAALPAAALTCAGAGAGDLAVVDPVVGEGGSRRRAHGQRSDYGPEKDSALAEMFNCGHPEPGRRPPPPGNGGGLLRPHETGAVAPVGRVVPPIVPVPGALRCVGDGQLRTSPPVRAAAPAP
jgi:hypothetical protein